jgi:hypothetical protein
MMIALAFPSWVSPPFRVTRGYLKVYVAHPSWVWLKAAAALSLVVGRRVAGIGGPTPEVGVGALILDILAVPELSAAVRIRILIPSPSVISSIRHAVHPSLCPSALTQFSFLVIAVECTYYQEMPAILSVASTRSTPSPEPSQAVSL